MRVVLTTESHLPYLSGVTVSVDALARGLGAVGHEVLVVAPRPAAGVAVEPIGSRGPAPATAWLPSYQLPFVVPPEYRMPWPNPWAAAFRAARTFRPDVVHAHSPFVTGVLARRLAAAVDAPLIFTHHTRFADYAHYLGPLTGPGGRLVDAYLRRFWRSCAAIVAPSEDLAGAIRARLGPEHASLVSVVPTGVDVEGIRAVAAVDPRALGGWPGEAVVAASLGRLAPEKSAEIVLEAVRLAAEAVPAIRLLIIGGGPSEAGLRARAAAPDLAGRVHFTGPLPRRAALAHLAGAEVFVFASRTETQGLVLAEALAAGLPAVAVDGPGIRDSVRDGVDGIVVAADPAHSRAARLGTALAGLAGDPGRRTTMAKQARADAGRFDVARRVAEIEALYRSVARGSA